MSWLGLFGGDTENKSTSTSNTETADQRVAVEGSVGSLVSPGAAVATPGGGAVNAAAGSTVTQSVNYSGLTGEDVQTLMTNLDADHVQERATITKIVGDATAALRGESEQVADILAATKTPDSNALTQLMPLLLLLGLLWFLSR